MVQALVLKTWGRGRHGVLGHSDGTDVDMPRQVEGVIGIVAIACGELHCLALTDIGSVLSWGSGILGALGHGITGACRTPAEVIGLRSSYPIVQIAAGRHHSLVGSAAGEVFSWGTLDSSAPCEPVPRLQVGIEGRLAQLGCGDSFCAALTDAGVFVWGAPRQESPYLLCRGSGMRALSCGASSIACLGPEGEAYVTPPVLGVEGRSIGFPLAIDVVQVRASCGKPFVRLGSGAEFAAALTAEGRVYVFTHAIAPLLLHGMRGTVAFLGSPAHVLAVDADGRLLHLAGAVQASSSQLALPLLRGAAEGAALERLLQVQLLKSPIEQLAVGGNHLAALVRPTVDRPSRAFCASLSPSVVGASPRSRCSLCAQTPSASVLTPFARPTGLREDANGTSAHQPSPHRMSAFHAPHSSYAASPRSAWCGANGDATLDLEGHEQRHFQRGSTCGGAMPSPSMAVWGSHGPGCRPSEAQLNGLLESDAAGVGGTRPGEWEAALGSASREKGQLAYTMPTGHSRGQRAPSPYRRDSRYATQPASPPRRGDGSAPLHRRSSPPYSSFDLTSPSRRDGHSPGLPATPTPERPGETQLQQSLQDALQMSTVLRQQLGSRAAVGQLAHGAQPREPEPHPDPRSGAGHDADCDPEPDPLATAIARRRCKGRAWRRWRQSALRVRMAVLRWRGSSTATAMRRWRELKAAGQWLRAQQSTAAAHSGVASLRRAVGRLQLTVIEHAEQVERRLSALDDGPAGADPLALILSRRSAMRRHWTPWRGTATETRMWRVAREWYGVNGLRSAMAHILRCTSAEASWRAKLRAATAHWRRRGYGRAWHVLHLGGLLSGLLGAGRVSARRGGCMRALGRWVATARMARRARTSARLREVAQLDRGWHALRNQRGAARQELILHETMRHAVACWHSLEQARVLRTWAGAVWAVGAMRHATRRRLRGALGSCFRKLACFAVAMRRLRTAVGRWQLRPLDNAFSRLAAYGHSIGASRRRVRAAVARWQQRPLGVAFASLRTNFATRVAARDASTLALRHKRFVRRRRAWRLLCVRCSHLQRREQRFRKATLLAQSTEARGVLYALCRIQAVSESRRSQCIREAHARGHWWGSVASCAMLRWRAVGVLYRHSCMLMQRTRFSSVRWAFSSWRRALLARAALLLRARQVLRHRRGIALLVWRGAFRATQIGCDCLGRGRVWSRRSSKRRGFMGLCRTRATRLAALAWGGQAGVVAATLSRRQALRRACLLLRENCIKERQKHAHTALVGESLFSRRLAALYHPLQLQRCLLTARALLQWRTAVILLTADGRFQKLQALVTAEQELRTQREYTAAQELRKERELATATPVPPTLATKPLPMAATSARRPMHRQARSAVRLMS